MWKQDHCTLVPENDSRDVTWRQRRYRKGFMEQMARDQDASGVWGGPWSRRLAVGHLAFELAQPAVGASEHLRGVALVAAVLGDGAACDGPFEVVQEPGERSTRL